MSNKAYKSFEFTLRTQKKYDLVVDPNFIKDVSRQNNDILNRIQNKSVVVSDSIDLRCIVETRDFNQDYRSIIVTVFNIDYQKTVLTDDACTIRSEYLKDPMWYIPEDHQDIRPSNYIR
ncbi:hypothetical protein ACK325_02520 [Aeromonas hydrophila]|uniref:hypothetical protein n=1 Tax=Aeromonas hydrophila TaxID=644 RepID=UPI003989B460